MITGNVIGGIIKNPDTIILVDEDGNEYTAVPIGEEVELTATVNDVRLGKTVALEQGIKTGEKEIPSYNTKEGYRIIQPGKPFEIANLNAFEYTKLQSLMCEYSTSLSSSVKTDKVSIGDNVYPVNSTEAISGITLDYNSKTIQFGVSNESDTPYVLRYFTYKEIY